LNVVSYHCPHCQRQTIAAWLPAFDDLKHADSDNGFDWLPHFEAVVRIDLGALSPMVSGEKQCG
jgi:hypothetical protein